MARVTHMTVVARLRIRVLIVEGGAGSVTHRICHVMVSTIPGCWAMTMHIWSRARTVVVLVRAVILTSVETSVTSASIGLGLALLA